MKRDIRAFYKPKFRGKRDFQVFILDPWVVLCWGFCLLRKSYSCIVFGIPTRVLLHDWIS